MITIPILGGGDYCVDKYEVSYSQYEVFWVANPVPSGQPQQCSWNTTYTPPENWPTPIGTGAYPVRNVDWCDAYGFCKWAGKRLCGKIGGGAADYVKPADPAVSQWYSACSAQGANVFPYGAAFDPLKCNTSGFACDPFQASFKCFPQDTMSGPRTSSASPLPCWTVTACSNVCQGGAPGLFDMSGNVEEWEDSCAASSGAGDECRARGGSRLDAEPAVRCDAPTSHPRSTTSATLGFRCCMD
jgi:formylglycine-generating enzyme required for sulfatase activity